jgi:DNA repair exonuclease SbcCD nuclease subunit
MARFIHTADWQIGKPFAGIEDAHNRALVQQERLAVIDRIGAAAREHGAEFVLVAGDLFDSPTPTRAMVSATCAAVGRIGLPVVAIPGNHDHGGAGGLWDQAFFEKERAELAPGLTILTAAVAFEIGGAVIFPCPLLRRAESADTTAWLREAGVLAGAGERTRIVLAHGSTRGFGGEPDDEEGVATAANRIELERLDAGEVDYVALGDWHGTKEVGPKAWYAGTPERDRFPKGEENRPGNVLAVSAGRGAAADVRVVPTGRYGWHRVERNLADDAAVDGLRGEIEELVGQRTQGDLLRLELTGTLGIAATTRLEALVETLAARLLRVKLVDRTTLAPSDAEVVALTQRTGDPLVARVAAELVGRAGGADEAAAVARVALRELHAAVGR